MGKPYCDPESNSKKKKKKEMTFMRQLENFFKVSWMLLYYLPT